MVGDGTGGRWTLKNGAFVFILTLIGSGPVVAGNDRHFVERSLKLKRARLVPQNTSTKDNKCDEVQMIQRTYTLGVG